MFSAYTEIVNLLNALPTDRVHLLSASALVLAVAAIWLFAHGFLRPNRAPPLASVLSDAILAGSHINHSDVPVERGDVVANVAMRPMQPVLGGLERLDENDGRWGFTIRDCGKPILTLTYPGREEANRAREVMQRAFRNSIIVSQPETSREALPMRSPSLPPPANHARPTRLAEPRAQGNSLDHLEGSRPWYTSPASRENRARPGPS